jgi:hypothetical protein
MRILAFCLGLTLAAAGCVSSPQTVEARVKPHTALVELMSGGHCSGTRAGPHLVLIATHCVDDNPGAVIVDGVPTNVTARGFAGEDWAWIAVDLTFESWAPLGPLPKVGDEVFFFGNVSILRGALRRGYVSAIQDGWLVVDINAGKGDSGAAVFNAKGQIIGVISGGHAYDRFTITLVQPVVLSGAP